jgi:LacI family transcriptional regulator
MAKVDRIVALLETRISRGDYALRPMPAENRLATEVGVSRMTARKAVLRLVERGLLARADNGRVVVNTGRNTQSGDPTETTISLANPSDGASPPEEGTRRLQIAFLAPAFASAEIDRWRVAVDRAVSRIGSRLRIVHFHHWQDPIFIDAAESFDGIFLVPPAEPIPDAVARDLRGGRAKVVALDADLTPRGIRSIDLIPPASVQRLLDQLAGLGHRSIHCFNSQPVDSVVEQRIEQWSLWRAAQGASGKLLNDPDDSYGDPPRKAYESMSRRLAEGPFGATAVFCVTMPAALGAMRAMRERGIIVGKDVSVCAANDEGIAAYLYPSLTATQMPDPLPYLTIYLEWMAGQSYCGPLLSRPTNVPLFIGESTGPAPV